MLKVWSFAMLALFYSIYTFKLLVGRKNGVKVNSLGKGKKSSSAMVVEIVMSLVSTSAVLAEALSILLVSSPKSLIVCTVLMAMQALSVAIFFMATKTMRLSWRVGIPDKKNSLVTDGIYKLSRNPAYLAFDIMHISITAAFFNPYLLILCVATIIMLHLQTLNEEKWLAKTFKDEYLVYFNSVNRYFGRKRT